MGHMDQRLTSLVSSVEAGASCIPLNLAVGQWIVQGTPVSTAEFISRTHSSLGNAMANQLSGRERRQVLQGQDDKTWQQIMHQAADMLTPITFAPAGPGGALSLTDVTMTGGPAGVVRVAAVRVALESINLWWLSEFRHDPAGGGGGGVGISF